MEAPAPPFGWIQWKGTDVCMDVHCACGALMHMDGMGIYSFTCGHCGETYEISGFVTLHPINREDGTLVLREEGGGT